MTILIAGTGLGGLTLAQSLRGHGLDVALHERDAGPWERRQGYRLHLDADARNAAREVLPDDLRARFDAACYATTPYTTLLRTDLSVIKRLPTHDEDDVAVWPDAARPVGHANVDRETLRRILLTGLEDAVHFGKALVRYVETRDGVTAHFADGTTARGDVLVGADGVSSAVRRQRAPHARVADAGITALYGRVPLPQGAELVPPEALGDIFAIAADDRRVFLGLGAVRPRATDDDYLVTVVGGRHEHLPRLPATGPGLQQVAADVLAGWPPRAAAVVRAGDPASFFAVHMRTSVPCTLGAPGRVTLLGDAIHAMTPTLGRGANLAMRDGALLGRALAAVGAGGTSLAEALTTYEQAMLEHGFAVVAEAARTGERRMAQDPLPR